MHTRRPFVVVHTAVSLDGATTGFTPDLERFYALVATWDEDVTLTGADTVLAQQPALLAAPEGPGPDPDGPLLAVVDSRSRVTAWDRLRAAGHWRDAVPVRGASPDSRVDLRGALEEFARQGAPTVRVDSGGALTGALLDAGLVDEISLLVHPCLAGPGQRHWTGGAAAGPALELLHEERLAPGLVWLRHRVRPPRGTP
jgi:2,5-diamino-6-(ribosylamino)-4(3H)-pyrimidinone 5'-phosphate reductase